MQQRDRVIDCYNKSAYNYAEELFHELDRKPFDRMLLDCFASQMQNEKVVLDLGCGCGHTTAYLALKGVRPIIGLDLSPGMIEEARRRNKSVVVDFEVGDMMKLAREDNSVDGILAFYAIVHFTVSELALVFKELHRVLKAGGLFLFSFHVGNESTHITTFFDREVEIDFHYFETAAIVDMLKDANWTVEEVIERHPYEGREYPSRRAYITCIK